MKPSQEFLTLLTPDDYSRAVAFLGVTTTTSVRVYLNTLMKRFSPALRSAFLDFCTVLDVPTVEKVVNRCAKLEEVMAERLFRMQWEVSWPRFLEILEAPPSDLVAFLSMLGGMDPADSASVLKTSGESGMTFGMLVDLLTSQATAPKCPVCDARRRIEKEVGRINGLVDEEAAAKFDR